MKILKKGIALLLAATLAVTSLPPIQTKAADPKTVTVNTSKTYQNIRGFGGMNHPEWIGDLTESQRKTAFGNGANDLGLTVLRVFVNPDSNQWSKAVPTAKYASDAGATVFATPWEPPSNLAESGGSGGKLHIPSKNYGAYATHLNNFGTYMKNNGVNLYSISVQNEPDYASEWTYWTPEETTNFIANYGDKITSTKLMSPESFQYAPLNASWVANGGKKFYASILANSKAMANTDVFGTHMYGTARDWMDYPALESCGKEIWMTEVYVPNSDKDSANRWPEAIQVAENIHNALVVGNMSVYTWWYIRRSYGLMTEDGKISKRGYMMAHYSKFIRPGYKRIEATEQPADNVYVSAYKGDGNKIVIVAVNKSSNSYAQYFSVGNEKIANVDRYRTTETDNLAETKNLDNDGSNFYAYLPSNSVTTFVITTTAASTSGGSSTTTPTVSTEAATIEDGWYYIKNVGSQKYLQVANNTGADSTNVEVGTGSGVAGQKWYLTNTSNGNVTLKNALGYMLDVRYGEKTDGANIQTYSANGADAQQFKIVKTKTSNVYGITTKITSDEKGLKADDTNVIQYTYDGSSNEQWALEKTSYSGSSSGGSSSGSGSTSGTVDTSDATLLNTYGKLFGYSGTSINVSELKNASMLNFLKKHYNSITLENEMKPDTILRAWGKQLITVAEAKSLGYVIPSNYTEAYVPKLNFDAVDQAISICYENGLKMRAHTLVWHSQTPDFFFRADYNTSNSYVSSSVMDARMEFYIRTVMDHVYNKTAHGKDVVYTWDVVNEYLNADTNVSGWYKVYKTTSTTPAFVKKAFTIASDELNQLGLKGKVSLFYNDFNTYMNADKIVTMINYINSDGKVCNGIGMQSHLGTTFPSPSYYKEALTKFKNAGFEIQITELDVTNLNGSNQPQYYYDIASAILDTKKNGGNISCFTLWGMWDSLSWITKMEGKEHTTPLLFTGIDQPKEDYYKVIKAYTDAGYTIGGSSSGSGTGTGGSTGGTTGGSTIDTTGYSSVDLSTSTAGTYSSSTKKLTISDVLQTGIKLPTTVKAGQTASVVINVTNAGTSDFRVWLSDGSMSSLTDTFTSASKDLSGDVLITLTPIQDCDYIVFKGPDYQTNINNLVVNSVKIKVNTSTSIELDKSYSEHNGVLTNNPLVTQKFIADPTSVEYNGRIYVYGTAEYLEFDEDGKPTENKFKTAKISVISSSDLVNWQDEGEIDVKSVTGGWAGNSWAPSITSKVINGTTYFFLYFANGGNGIGVLRSTSPTGPWTDPLGHALITRSTPNCASVTWLFDPAVFVDDDGTGYLAFGGGVPDGKEANPQTGRIVKLGSDMISLAGDPQLLDAPYLFEDSELNKINGKYVYSYCKNWNTTDGTSATIGYMTSSNPLSGYSYKGVIVKNPGSYFGSNLTSNNHHHMFQFKGQWYILYHTVCLEKEMYGTNVGYRSLNIDKVNVASDGTITSTMTQKGVTAATTFNPYNKVNATTMAWNGGIKTAYDSKVAGMVVDNAKTGNWIGLNNVAFGTAGANKVTFNVATTTTCTIDVYIDAPTTAKGGKKVGYAQISSGAADYRDVTAILTETVTGTHDVYFVFGGAGIDVASWEFTEKNNTPTIYNKVNTPSSGLEIGVAYGNPDVVKFSVLQNMTKKTSSDIEGYSYYYQGTKNPTFTTENIPDSGTAAFKIEASKNSNIKFVVRNVGGSGDSSKTYFVVDSDGNVVKSAAMGAGADGIKAVDIEFTAISGKTYYCYVQGSKMMVMEFGYTSDKIEAVAEYDADYSAVDAAIAKVPADMSKYTEESVKAVTDAVSSVVRGKKDTEQSAVNAMAKAIEDAIAALEIKPVTADRNGLVYVNGTWGYYKDNVIDTTFKGFAEANGSQWLVENGTIKRVSGYYNDGTDIYVIKDGKFDTSRTDLLYVNDVWYYFRNGKVDWTYTSLAYANNAWWFVRNGKLDKTYSGLVPFRNQMWYVTSGKLDKTYVGTSIYNNVTYSVKDGIGTKMNTYTGLTYVSGVWVYLSNGMPDSSYKGVTTYNGSIYFVENGTLSKKSGIWEQNGEIYYISEGKVNPNIYDLTYHNGKWYYFRGGVVDWTYNDLAWANDAWWYVKDGQLDKSYTGLYLFRNQLWYINAGKLDKSYTGTCVYNGETYTVKNGVGTK